MHRFAIAVLAALVLAPAGVAARTVEPGHLNQPSLEVSPPWGRIANWDLSKRWHTTQVSAPRAQQKDSTTTARQTALEGDLLHEINDVRREHGLRPLALSPKLTAAAVQHTREMGADGYFEHESFDNTEFWKRIEHWYPSKGFGAWAVGENLLYSAPELESAPSGVQDWMASPGHRANLLSHTWREIGLAAMHFDSAPGEYDGGPVTIVTADFGYRR